MRTLIFVCSMILGFTFSLALGGCGTTVEQRETYRETGVLLALATVDLIHEIGVGPDEIDPDILRGAKAACRMLVAGGPLITEAINRRVDEASAVTLAEYQATLDAACDVIVALLSPEGEDA